MKAAGFIKKAAEGEATHRAERDEAAGDGGSGIFGEGGDFCEFVGFTKFGGVNRNALGGEGLHFGKTGLAELCF